MSVRFVGRRNVAKLVATLADGSTVYDDDRVTFRTPERTISIRPPFGIGHAASYDGIEPVPLLAALDRDRRVGAFLVRLGGYAVGIFEGERLVISKVGQRLVHGRHRAGGSSANRFRRRREEQARMLHDDAAEEAVRLLLPELDRLDAVVLGGDRTAVAAALEADPRLAPLRERATLRFLTTPDPRRAVLERLPYEIYAAEVSDSEAGPGAGHET